MIVLSAVRIEGSMRQTRNTVKRTMQMLNIQYPIFNIQILDIQHKIKLSLCKYFRQKNPALKNIHTVGEVTARAHVEC